MAFSLISHFQQRFQTFLNCLNSWEMPLWGSLLGLSAPGYNLWWLAWLVITPALQWAYQCQGLKKRAWGGFWFGFCFQAVYCAWFFDLHPLTWLGFDSLSSRLVTLAGWLLIATEGGILTSVFFSLAHTLAQPKIPFLGRLLGLPLIWVGLFSLLNATPLALPWGLLEYTQVGLWPMRWLASVAGGLSIPILLVGVAVLLAEARLKKQTGPTSQSSQTGRHQNIAHVWGLPAGLALLSMIPTAWEHHSPFPISVAVIQANLPIELIRSGRLTLSTIDSAYLKPIKKGAFPPETLILLPEEGVVPGLVQTESPQKHPIAQRLMTLAAQKKLWIAVGVSSYSGQAGPFNSIALISPHPSQPVQFYHKRRLVPFGEYTPYQLGDWLSSILQRFQVEYSAPYQPGSHQEPLSLGVHKLGGLVCFEVIDGAYSQTYQRKGADLLINLSNLGWFHQNPLIEQQFLAIGQLRAAESRTPLVIASNTGISVILSASGAVLKKTKPLSSLEINAPKFHPQVLFYNTWSKQNSLIRSYFK